ncbi:MAG: YceI family protein [Gemmatimonadota bacterium]
MSVFSLLPVAAILFASSSRPLPVAAWPVDTSETVWQIDPGHSDVSFRIRHFMSKVRGTFKEWNGTIRADSADWSKGSVNVAITTSSIDTGNERRDNDLRSANFFDAAIFPSITFTSRKVEVNGRNLRVSGDLSMHGVTKPVVLEGSFLGIQPGPQGSERIGFEVRTTINRLDYGVTWNRAVEGGGVMLGDEVEIDISVEGVRRS